MCGLLVYMTAGVGGVDGVGDYWGRWMGCVAIQTTYTSYVAKLPAPNYKNTIMKSHKEHDILW
jgi:hypothetical protein